MIRTHRSSTTAVLIVCMLGAASNEILLAADDASFSRAESSSLSADTRTTAAEDVSAISAGTSSARELPGTAEFVRSFQAHSPLVLADDTVVADSSSTFATGEPSQFAQRGYGRRGYRGRNNGAIAAMAVGAAAAIAGTAVLVYANRPECNAIPTASGCGYGTKVIGGSVLSAGVVGLLIGALTWR